MDATVLEDHEEEVTRVYAGERAWPHPGERRSALLIHPTRIVGPRYFRLHFISLAALAWLLGREKYCQRGHDLPPARAQTRPPAAAGSMIGTYGPTAAPRKFPLCRGKILGCRGADAFGGAHELEWFHRKEVLPQRGMTFAR
jgi:hypothetical protein